MKKILMVATGGTIASTQAGSGLAPTLTGHELAAMVPGIDGLCELDVCQPMNIDSTNMRPRDWLAVRDTIVDAYDDYDGFVVLHGTDTMAYTAAALSYLIQGSPKPIVLTGSQQPMANPFTDAKLNLYQSLLYALDDASRDVCVVFGGDVICGTRARKQRTMSFNAFTSMNMPPLACIRNNRIVRPATLPVAYALPAQGDARAASAQPRLFDTLDERVIVIRLTPELGPSVLDLLARDYDAVVLETFGIGGIPDYGGGWHAAISRWVESGRIVVVTTQVPEEGLDLGVYEVGRAYANMGGVLAAGDMTVEAIVAKTMWALGQTRNQARVAELFAHPVNNDRTA
ncbi:asparaginase [Atopobiaceae bacterium SGI.236]